MKTKCEKDIWLSFEKITVNVTQEDIRLGEPDSFMTTPTGLALSKLKYHYCVNSDSITFLTWPYECISETKSDMVTVSIPIPDIVRSMEKKFTAGKKIKPFKFTMIVPCSQHKNFK